MPEAREEVVALLALERSEGVSHRLLRELLAHFGSARAALAGDWSLLAKGAAGCRRPGEAEFAWAADQWARLAGEGGRCLAPVDAGYPALLRQIPAPPPVLFVLGPDDLAGPTVAIVGPRGASQYGLQVAGELAAGLAQRGVCVVSGMAFGIDGAAHKGALRAGGRTVAVLGGGADLPTPQAQSALYAAIRERGAIVSEFPLGAHPTRQTFPQRNRIISGLSLGVVVVEAPLKSGSLITVTHAVEQNREVFAVPGDVRSGFSAGCHQLLRDGAKLVEGVDDVVEEIGHWAPPRTAAPELPPGDERVYALLTREPRHIDELARDSTLPPQDLLETLLRLELDGLVDQLAGKRFLRRPR